MQHDSMSCCYQFRVILIGDSKVGKTSLLHRLKTKSGQLPSTTTTIGIDFHATTLQVNDTTVNFQLWDTAGQEDFKSITTSFFRNAVAGLLVFDVTNRNSFHHLHEWISEAKANSHPEHDIVLLLVGNKADLDTKREVSYDEAESFASQKNMNYIETSAKNGTNVHEAAVEMTKILLSQIEGGELVGIRPLKDSTSTSLDLNISSATSSYSFSPASQSQPTTDSVSNGKTRGCCRQ